ncbi:MAG: hypothetical protein N2322_04140, partial [Terrimicrobiaceae bacterium]|nr:hypothetical protein [Terrimicrobiaceae bacterium]
MKPAADAAPPPYAPARLGIPEADLRVAARLGALGIKWKIVAPGEFEFWVGFEGEGFHCIVLPADLSKLGPWSHVVCVTVEISDEPFPEPVLERARQFNQ